MEKRTQGLTLYEYNRQRGFPYQKIGALKTNKIRSLKSAARLAIQLIMANEDRVLDLLADLGVPFALVAKHIDNPRALLNEFYEFKVTAYTVLFGRLLRFCPAPHSAAKRHIVKFS